MRKYIPVSKKAYSWTPTSKVLKAMKPIVNNVKISSLSAAQKNRFQKQFISDCNNKNIGNVRGDSTIDRKGLDRVFREALEKKTLPAEWIADRYKSLLTKGGVSLSSKWEKAPNTKASGMAQKIVSRKEKLHEVAIKRKELEKRTEQITRDRNELCQLSTENTIQKAGESKISEGAGEKKPAMNRFQTETFTGKNKQELTSGGIKRTGKTGEKSSAANTAVKGSKQGNKTRGLSYGMSKVMLYKEPPLRHAMPDDAVPKFNIAESDNKLNSNMPESGISDESLYSKEILEKLALAKQAYDTGMADSASEKPKNKDLEFGGISKENDSFGLDDQKNT